MKIKIYHLGQVVRVEEFQTLKALRARYVDLQRYESVYAQVVLKGKALTTAQAYKALDVRLPCVAYRVTAKRPSLCPVCGSIDSNGKNCSHCGSEI